MRQTLSTFVAIALLVGLGALAVLALPNGQVAVNPAPVAVAAQVAAGPEAILGTNKYNVIAMPLDSQNQFSNAGLTYDAAGLGAFVGTGVKQVLTWNANAQTYLSWDMVLQDGDNFSLQTGGVYWLLLDNTAANIVSFVGDVPAQGAIHFNLVRPSGSGCLLNDISIPLDQSGITTPQGLADSIGNVAQVLQWNASAQTFLSWDVDLQDGDNFTIKIGYPYRVCLKAGGVTTWP